MNITSAREHAKAWSVDKQVAVVIRENDQFSWELLNLAIPVEIIWEIYYDGECVAQPGGVHVSSLKTRDERIANHIDGYDRDDLGLSPDYEEDDNDE